MKTLVIFSDTHGNRTALRKAHQIMQEADYVIHLGDGLKDMYEFGDVHDKLFAVDGNCDGGFCGTREMILTVENHKILLTHGDLYGVKRGLDTIYSYAQKLGCDVVLYGHNHQKSIIKKENVLLINPGSLSYSTIQKSFCYLVINGESIVPTINEKLFQ